MPIIFEPGCAWMQYLSGIYKITFGEKFYIGRSHFIYKRRYEHYISINKIIAGNSDPKLDYYGGLSVYLKENPKIKVGYMKVIYASESYEEMCAAEDVILRSYVGNSDILNRGFYSHSHPITPKFMMKLIEKNNKKYFLNKLHEELIKEGDELAWTGKIKTRNTQSEKSDTLSHFDYLQSYLEKFGKTALESQV